MRTVVLVAGPPCSGKSTYVAQRAKPGDLVLDQDAIGARAMRQGIARVAAMVDGTAWVIRCCPGPQRRQAFAAQIRATDVVLLTAPEPELIARATQRPDPRRHIQAVRDWFRREAADAPPRQPRPPARRNTTDRGYGWAYQQARREMFAIYGTVCHLCGHDGAHEADHLDPLARNRRQRPDPHRMRPAHGTRYPCPTCRRKCNQERGARPIGDLFRPRLDW